MAAQPRRAAQRAARLAVDASGNVFVATPPTRACVRFRGPSLPCRQRHAGLCGRWRRRTSAQLNTPVGLAVDKSGNLYIADVDESVVRKVSAAAESSPRRRQWIAGVFGRYRPAIGATSMDGGLAVDASGNLYISDTLNGVIRKVTSAEPFPPWPATA